ncbi:hypothetical protein SE17_20755, partial [Kouleothrix aurantiaca]
MARESKRHTIIIATATHTTGLLLNQVLNHYLKATTFLIHTSGVDVLDSIACLDVDLIIVDEWMSDMNAYDLSQAIKGARPHLPVILLAALATPALHEAIQHGLFDGILIKPLQMAQHA